MACAGTSRRMTPKPARWPGASYTVPGDPSQGIRIEGHGNRREDLDRRMVEDRRRRHALGRHRLRPRAGPAVLRNGQPHRLVPRAPRRRRQSVHGVDPGRAREQRRTRLVFPNHARRQLGLRRHAAADAGRPDHRRPRAQSDHAGEQERVLLRSRSRDRRVHFRRAIRRAASRGPRDSIPRPGVPSNRPVSRSSSP